MSSLRYLMDEHVTPQLQKALKQRVPEMVVWRIGDPGSPPFGALDPDILLWCEAHAFVLVTNNRHSMPVHLREHLAAGHHIPGIFVIKTNICIGGVSRRVRTHTSDIPEGEYADTIFFLPIS
ncbi:MAG: DUF5615 family PIN-like protein [Chloroflexaceae bacterium]|nr:DUF5615 family PIN-like protein [Chloroflexaceae bacterium]